MHDNKFLQKQGTLHTGMQALQLRPRVSVRQSLLHILQACMYISCIFDLLQHVL